MIGRTMRWPAALATALAAVLVISIPVSASASNAPASCNIGVPAFVTLFPISSTHVSPGQTIDVGIGLINLETRPSSIFYFQKAGDGVFPVRFDDGTNFRLEIPTDWRFGRYRLVKIETHSLDARGVQFRSFAIEGVDFEGAPHTGTCPLDLSVLDLVVSAGHR